MSEVFWMVDGDPASSRGGSGLRYFSEGWKAVTPSSLHAYGEQVSEEYFEERVAVRDRVRAEGKAARAST